MEVKDKENKLNCQVLSGLEDNKCFSCNKKDCKKPISKKPPNGRRDKYINTLSREVLILP